MNHSRKHFNVQMGLVAVCTLLLGRPGLSQPDTLWTRELEGGGSWLDIIRTNDGGYAIGSAQWPGDERRFTNMLLQKTDSLGQPEWLRFYARSDSNDRRFATWASTIRQMSDGGFVLAGMEPSGSFIIRLDNRGDVLWMKLLSEEEYGMRTVESCEIGDDGNIVVVGNDRAVKLDDSNEGDVIWARSYDIRGGEYILQVYRALEGGYLLIGLSTSIGEGAADMFAVKVNDDGEVIWRDSYGTRFNEVCAGAIQTIDGDWCLVGSQRFGMSDSTHAFAVGINSDGEEVWRHVYSEYRRGNVLISVAQVLNGGYLMGGNDGTASCFLLIRTNMAGEPLWRGRYRGARGSSHAVISIMPNQDGSYTFGGDSNAGTLLIRTRPDTTHNENEVVILDPAFPSLLMFTPPYPNPFNSSVTIPFYTSARSAKSAVHIAIFDPLGRRVAELIPDGKWKMENGTKRSFVWNANGMPAGQYIVRLEAGDQQLTQRLQLVK